MFLLNFWGKCFSDLQGESRLRYLDKVPALLQLINTFVKVCKWPFMQYFHILSKILRIDITFTLLYEILFDAWSYYPSFRKSWNKIRKSTWHFWDESPEHDVSRSLKWPKFCHTPNIWSCLLYEPGSCRQYLRRGLSLQNLYRKLTNPSKQLNVQLITWSEKKWDKKLNS